jgi:hypothetical protein
MWAWFVQAILCVFVCMDQYYKQFNFKHPHTVSCNDTSCISQELCADRYPLFGVFDM